jgi:hypothetical protein
MSTSIVHRIIVLIGLTLKAGIAAFIERAKAIVNAMQSNAKIFTSPSPSFTQTLADIQALEDAQTAFKNHVGTKAVRDDKLKIVANDMQQHHGYVQQLVNASPAEAATIAAAASMTLRNPPARHKSDLAVKHVGSGTVKLTARGEKLAHAHNWQLSTDGGKTWVDAPDTTRASTTITGLTPGANVMYRHRVLTKAGPGDWSQAIAAIVG